MQAARLATRLQRELRMLQTDPPPGVCAWPCNDSLSHLEAQIQGPDGTVYAQGIFKLEVRVPDRYPFEPPSIRFSTPIYHPNIDSGGRICLDILNMPPKGAWKPSLNIPTVLASIGLLLAEPNPDDGLMGDITTEYKHDRVSFDMKAKMWTQQYAVHKHSEDGTGDAKVTPESDFAHDKSTTMGASIENPTMSASFKLQSGGKRQQDTSTEAYKTSTGKRATGNAKGEKSSVSSNLKLNLSVKLSLEKGAKALEKQSSVNTAGVDKAPGIPERVLACIDNTVRAPQGVNNQSEFLNSSNTAEIKCREVVQNRVVKRALGDNECDVILVDKLRAKEKAAVVLHEASVNIHSTDMLKVKRPRERMSSTEKNTSVNVPEQSVVCPDKAWVKENVSSCSPVSMPIRTAASYSHKGDRVTMQSSKKPETSDRNCGRVLGRLDVENETSDMVWTAEPFAMTTAPDAFIGGTKQRAKEINRTIVEDSTCPKSANTASAPVTEAMGQSSTRDHSLPRPDSNHSKIIKVVGSSPVGEEGGVSILTTEAVHGSDGGIQIPSMGKSEPPKKPLPVKSVSSTIIVLDSESDEEPPKGRSRLSLASRRKGMKKR